MILVRMTTQLPLRQDTEREREFRHRREMADSLFDDGFLGTLDAVLTTAEHMRKEGIPGEGIRNELGSYANFITRETEIFEGDEYIGIVFSGLEKYTKFMDRVKLLSRIDLSGPHRITENKANGEVIDRIRESISDLGEAVRRRLREKYGPEDESY